MTPCSFTPPRSLPLRLQRALRRANARCPAKRFWRGVQARPMNSATGRCLPGLDADGDLRSPAFRLDGSHLRRGDDCIVRGSESEDRRHDLGQPDLPAERREGAVRKTVLTKDPFGGLGEIDPGQIDGARVPHVELLHGGDVSALQGGLGVEFGRPPLSPKRAGMMDRSGHPSAGERKRPPRSRRRRRRSESSRDVGFGGARIERRRGGDELLDLAREARGIGCREPAALTDTYERYAAAEVVDGDIEIAEIGVDAVVAHLGGRRLPEGQREGARAFFCQRPGKGVPFGKVGDRGIVDRVRPEITTGRADAAERRGSSRNMVSRSRRTRWKVGNDDKSIA